MRVGIICFELAIAANLSKRGSGTATSPTLGSIVQNGKFAACAAAVFVSALNRVDLPTFGNPTIPILNPMMWPFFAQIFDGVLLCALPPWCKRGSHSGFFVRFSWKFRNCPYCYSHTALAVCAKLELWDTFDDTH